MQIVLTESKCLCLNYFATSFGGLMYAETDKSEDVLSVSFPITIPDSDVMTDC